MMAGESDTARASYLAALDVIDPTQNRWETAYIHSGLGRSAIVDGDRAAALRAFQVALRKSQEIGDRGLGLMAVEGYAALLAAQGASTRALELAAFLVHERATWAEPRKRAAALLARLAANLPAANLPADAVATAEKRARQLSLEHVFTLLSEAS
jgi:hypothetical protein